MKQKLKVLIDNYSNYKITATEILTSSYKYPHSINYFNDTATDEMFNNLEKLLKTLNIFREYCEMPFVINSGFRLTEQNNSVGGAKNSNHTKCLAVDIKDITGKIDEWFLLPTSQTLLRQYNCSIEHPFYTKNWCHFQCVLPKSKKIVFKPYSREPNKYEYDEKFKFLSD